MTVSAGEIQLPPLSPVELSAFFIPATRAGMRHIDSHGLAVELFSVGRNQPRHLAAFNILYRFLAVCLETTVDIAY